jgi:hypothetical protein
VVVVDKLGVVKEVPLPTCVVSAASLYHFIVPVPLAVKVTVPFPHLDPPVPVGALGIAFTVAVTESLVAETQPVVVFLACA